MERQREICAQQRPSPPAPGQGAAPCHPPTPPAPGQAAPDGGHGAGGTEGSPWCRSQGWGWFPAGSSPGRARRGSPGGSATRRAPHRTALPGAAGPATRRPRALTLHSQPIWYRWLRLFFWVGLSESQVATKSHSVMCILPLPSDLPADTEPLGPSPPAPRDPAAGTGCPGAAPPQLPLPQPGPRSLPAAYLR